MPADLNVEADRFKHELSLGYIRPPAGCEGAVSGSDVALSTTEAIIATHAPLHLPERKVAIFAWARVAVAATSTDPIFAIRKGALVTDPLVGETVSITALASTNHVVQFFKIDASPAANQQYVLTGDMTTGTGTASEFGLLVIPLG